MAIIGTTLLVPYLWIKSLQLIWKSGFLRFNLRVPALQMNCSDLDNMAGYQDSSTSNDRQVASVIVCDVPAILVEGGVSYYGMSGYSFYDYEGIDGVWISQ